MDAAYRRALVDFLPMNRLASESSPYLRQHADNPVDWYSWGREAFEKAKASDRPVLLSVGYSACHWCHVMAHESFEDEATAKVMNELFVNVKVDREERPDVDAIYMEAVQAMTGQGGWPMTVFLTPDGRPFFAGTYFPKEPYGGHPAFVEVLHAIDVAWREQSEDVSTQADRLRDAIAARTTSFPVEVDVHSSGSEWLDNAFEALRAAYDKEWGGFGRAPKFPQTSMLELLLRRGTPEAITMVTNTLDAMASGGIYDHLGGGFHRYSVDAFWMVPHFEKMLYDQASLASIYLHAYQITGNPHHRQVLEETIGYVQRDLAAPDGGWYCAQDADSEGEEGRFYVWRPEEIEAALDDAALSEEVKRWYGVTSSGNFEGSNILHRPVRGDLLRSPELDEAVAALLQARGARVGPGLDDKVLTEWNAMMVTALAEAGAALANPAWIEDATRGADFLLENLRDESGRWHRVWHRSTGARQLAYANDYACLLRAFLALAEATGGAQWRSEAKTVADEMLRLFWDSNSGGLFTTGEDAERLVVRTKDLLDGALPSANSTAAGGLVELASVTGDFRYREAALSIIALVAEPLKNHPTAFPGYLSAVDSIVTDPTETVIAGNHPELTAWVLAGFLPRNTVLWGEPDESPLWEGRDDGAYVCRNRVCDLPALTLESLSEQLHPLHLPEHPKSA